MNVWKVTTAGNPVKTEEETHIEEGKRRVRIKKVYVNREDTAIAKGLRKVKYPFIPGRFAVGQIADDGGSALFPKNARVLLHSFLPADETGVEKKSFIEDDFVIPGRTADGYLRDFVNAGEGCLTPIPDAVNDEKALLLPYVALAQATVDSLDVKRGEHIAVIGADLIGLFISRLLIYRQAAPILVDSRDDRLEYARSRGVYYTSRTDDGLMDLVGTVTGGRLADGVVFVTGSGETDISLALNVCAPEKNVVLCGTGGDALQVDLDLLLRKRLTLRGVTDGTEELETAINLVANKAIDVNKFNYLIYGPDKIIPLLLSIGKDRPVDEICVCNLV